jgi:hypothetical protein
MSTTTPTLSSQLSDLQTKLVLYYLTPIYVIGMLGNIFNVIIFLRRGLRLNACSQYFVGMSIAQIIIFNSIAITRIITYSTGYDLGRTVAVLCKIRMYLYVLGLGLMRQFLCLISIDRWIISAQDVRIRRLSSPRVVRWLIIGSTLFWILFSIHALIGYEVSPASGCTMALNSDYASFYAIQITVSSIGSFIIMVMFSIFTLRNVRGRRHIQVAAQIGAAITVVITTLPRSINHRRREMQLIKLSLLQVIFYVLLCMTATTYPLYSLLISSQTKSSDRSAIDGFIGSVSLLLLYTYTAVCLIIS